MTRKHPSRRDVLAGVATAGTAVGLFGATASARTDRSPGSAADPTDPNQDEEPLETIELGAEVSGFQGVAPESIAGETNPTLEFEEVGGQYRVEWENLDGIGHNFQLRNADSEVLAETEFASGAGETRSVTFEATTEMVEYACRPHATSMSGDVVVGDDAGTTTASGEETTTGGDGSDGGEGGSLPGFGVLAALGGAAAAGLARLRGVGGAE